MSSTYLAFRGYDEKKHLLSRGEEAHTKKSAHVPNIEEPYYHCYHFLSGRFQKEAK
jgi:hypothetical protein